MLPKPPPSLGRLGYLFFPPYRVQGTSVAGEATAVMAPEFDVCFDIGICHKPMLTAQYAAITHGHMDHVGGLPYYFSQRRFQGMGVGVGVCDKRIESAVHDMMRGWIGLEQQATEYEIIGLDDGEEVEIKKNIFLRAFHIDHTVPCVGYSIIEKRSKLRPELSDLPQSELTRRARAGETITYDLRVPIVTYIGDTLAGPHLLGEHVCNAHILIMECTFFERGHKDRALIGKHIHISDLAELMPRVKAQAVVLTHISRRTHLGVARDALNEYLKPEDAARIHFLMDHRVNRKRFDMQLAEATKNADSTRSTTDVSQ